MQCLLSMSESSFPHLFSKWSRFEWYIYSVCLCDICYRLWTHQLPPSHVGCLAAPYKRQAHFCLRAFAPAVLLASVSLPLRTCRASPHLLQVLLDELQPRTWTFDNPSVLFYSWTLIIFWHRSWQTTATCFVNEGFVVTHPSPFVMYSLCGWYYA